MAQTRLLLCSSEHLSAWQWCSSGPVLEGRFTQDQEGLQAFAAYTAKVDGSVFRILADGPDEGMLVEKVPPVRGADREALLTRKLGQLFFGSPYVATQSLGREKSGRRDERVLLMALTRPAQIETWLAILRAEKLRLASIHTAALLVASMAGKRVASEGPALFVTLTQSGLRTTFFQDGHMHLSRLTPVAAAQIGELANAVLAETQKTHQYLLGQRLISRSKPLRTLVAVCKQEQATFADLCRDGADLTYEWLDLQEVGRSLDLKAVCEDSHCDALLLDLLARRPPATQLAPNSERQYFRLWRARFGLNIAAILVLLACTLFSVYQLIEAGLIESETASTRRQAELDRRQYEQLLEALPPLPTSADGLRNLVTRMDDLERHSPSFEETCLHVSRALTVSPRVEIDRLVWQLATSADETGGGATGSTASSGPAQFAVLQIDGRLPLALASDHRALLEVVDGFVKELAKDKAYAVRISRMPFDIESEKTMRSGNEGSAGAEPPHFSVRLTRKLG